MKGIGRSNLLHFTGIPMSLLAICLVSGGVVSGNRDRESSCEKGGYVHGSRPFHREREL